MNLMDLDHGTLFVGVDLAWAEGSSAKVANESGVVCIDSTGQVIHAGWTVGVTETVKCIQSLTAEASRAVVFIDAPLVVTNESGQRPCERQVGQRYGLWLLSANSTNVRSKRKAGVTLLAQLENLGCRCGRTRLRPTSYPSRVQAEAERHDDGRVSASSRRRLR